MRRRRFLIGLGGITVGLPFLRKFAGPGTARAGGSEAMPKRIITMGYPMGTHIPAFAPTATGSNFEFGPITASMEPFKDRTLVISNCPNAVLDLGGNTHVYGHPAKKETVFTGTLMQSAFVGDGSNHVDNVVEADPDGFDRAPNGPSFDQTIADFLRDGSHLRPSVDLGVWGGGGARDNENSDFFYESAANPVLLSAHPGRAFASLFNGVNPDDGEIDEAFMALQRRKQSVLDAVRGSFTDLRQGLDAPDRAILDEHADKIRQIELDMPPIASCTIPEDIPASDEAYAGMSMLEIADFQNRLMAQAMGCALAPVGRIEYLDQQNPFFGVPMIDDGVAPAVDWHEVVHATTGDWTKDHPVRVAGFTFFVERFAELCAHLDSIVEGADGQTVLDNSIVVLGSDLAEGEGHASRDLCFLIAGGSGPGRRGYHLEGSGYNTNRVLNSIVRMAGVTDDDGNPVEEVGLRGFAPGSIPELFG